MSARRVVSGLAPALAAALLVAGCGGSSGGPHGAEVDTARVGDLGPVLTTSGGRTLYMFPPDAERHVTCVRLCAATWPPLITAGHQAPVAGPGVEQSLLGTDPDPAGGARVVTYDGWPLYTYADDVKPRQANGQAVYSDGGYWYVLAPNGQPITAGA